ncbi:MAG: hypothetical protein HQL53_13565, partial [Magnetococcales bacterium]|nr:hypothetical protein [Magnetococcales bacterium]
MSNLLQRYKKALQERSFQTASNVARSALTESRKRFGGQAAPTRQWFLRLVRATYFKNQRQETLVTHKGITLQAVNPPSERTFLVKILDERKAFSHLRKAIDFLMEGSAYAKQQIKRMQAKGPIVIHYVPEFSPWRSPGTGETTFAVFIPSLLVRRDGGPTFPVIVGRHVVKWPTDQLAWVLAHELIGHGIQRLTGALANRDSKDIECEAYLRHERVLQDFGLWKNSNLF